MPLSISFTHVNCIIAGVSGREVAEEVLRHVRTSLQLTAGWCRLPAAPAIPVGGTVVREAVVARVGRHSTTAVVGILAAVEESVLEVW